MRIRAHRVLDHLRRQWTGTLALFLVLTGGTAYALDGSNTVFTDDIVNGEVKVADIGQGAVATEEIVNGQVKAADIGDGEVKSAEIANGQVLTADIGGDQVRGSHVLNDNLTGADIAANTLKGADIDENSLDIGDTARAYALVQPLGCTGTPGTCAPGRVKGVTSVTREDVGIYCVTAPGIDATDTPAAVTVDRSSTEGPNDGNASAMWAAGACGPTSKGFLVFTQRQPLVLVDAGSGTNNAVVSGPAIQADDVGFTIVIP
jgi:hypothetical protein